MKKLLLCLFGLALAGALNANNISISNATLTGQNTSSNFYLVQFDISWENSWLTSSGPSNWDAAWVFVKYRVKNNYYSAPGATGSTTTITVASTTGLRVGMPVSVTTGAGVFAAGTVVTAITNGTTFTVSAAPTTALTGGANIITGQSIWEPAWLNNTGNTAPSGSTMDMGLLDPATAFNATTNPGLGVFMYRSANGTGTNTWTGAKLQWNYGANGVADNAMVEIRVFAIEMVYVPTGAFKVGSGGTESGSFTTGTWSSGATIPLSISSESAITIGNSTGNLWGTSTTGNNTIGGAGSLPDAFPKGYNKFYAMKYEITQQEYVDFLNSLTQNQASACMYSGSSFRYAISGSSVGSYTTGNPYIGCNDMSLGDMTAFLDWSCLRPKTELEFEKACRGTAYAVANEYAWGNTNIAGSQYTFSNFGATNEVIASNYSTSAGNAAYTLTTPNDGTNGPVRAGIFAGTGGNTGRITSGASFYGIMELSGNLKEHIVTVADTRGRLFTGNHGNGAIDASGVADVANWPLPATGAGACLRGGDWDHAATDLRVSDRSSGGFTPSGRNGIYGGRGVRTAP